MSAPYEIMTGPLEVWLAPVGETFPDVDATPGGNWTDRQSVVSGKSVDPGVRRSTTNIKRVYIS